MKILVIENNRRISESICIRLNENGFQTETVSYSQYYGDREVYNSCDLIMYVVDRQENMNNIIGFSRPVIFVLDQADIPQKINGFYIGMEDYITEPVNTTELIFRINMLLRCFGVNSEHKLKLGGLSIDIASREVTLNEKIVPLTAREFNIIYGLLSNPYKTFTRKELMSEYWNEDSTAGKRVVDVYMTKLRDKFSECNDFQIVTVHGVGYKAVLK
ncbi:MAG: response regulator transcription factor [Oscillospiraceae bacterium]|nr:response regulator transcription factor [Oscillospiraceae bacterium]